MPVYLMFSGAIVLKLPDYVGVSCFTSPGLCALYQILNLENHGGLLNVMKEDKVIQTSPSGCSSPLTVLSSHITLILLGGSSFEDLSLALPSL
jgi:hypothetical protein